MIKVLSNGVAINSSIAGGIVPQNKVNHFLRQWKRETAGHNEIK